MNYITPQLYTLKDGTQEYMWCNKYHRDNGPAIIRPNGDLVYYKHGLLHRNRGPAVMNKGTRNEYFINNNRHRLNAPAIICFNGYIEYWRYGRRF